MLLVGSDNARVGFADGMRILRRGGRALDAVEATIRRVEANPADHSVGLGGLPNITGEVELDASVMDGRTLEAGAVCAVRGYPHVISLARQVMARLPHVLVAGTGAERLARELGMPKKKLLTAPARGTYARKVTGRLGRQGRLIDRVRAATRDPEIAASTKDYFGTVNVIAIDRRGDIASGVSTSGWAWKYPGRVGDSPIIGAGNYADNRYGACACTGYGEMAIRSSTAHSVVLYMKVGGRWSAQPARP
jgi:beta-aspartyl-peptidase (threonine type)